MQQFVFGMVCGASKNKRLRNKKCDSCGCSYFEETSLNLSEGSERAPFPLRKVKYDFIQDVFVS